MSSPALFEPSPRRGHLGGEGRGKPSDTGRETQTVTGFVLLFELLVPLGMSPCGVCCAAPWDRHGCQRNVCAHTAVFYLSAGAHWVERGARCTGPGHAWHGWVQLLTSTGLCTGCTDLGSVHSHEQQLARAYTSPGSIAPTIIIRWIPPLSVP